MEREERIVCAANKTKKGVFLGVRHHCPTMNNAIQGRTEAQGFITSRHRFVDRQEAWRIAEAAGQILYRCGGDTACGGTLYSENLY